MSTQTATEPTQEVEARVKTRIPTICWWPFHDNGLHPDGPNFTPEQMCDLVDRIGGKHDIPPREHWELIASRGQDIDCTMCEWTGSLAGSAPFFPSIGEENPTRRNEILRQMKEWMILAASKGIPKMLCFFGNISGDNAEAQWERIDDSLIDLTAHAAEVGIQLCFEPLNSVDFGKIPLAGMKGHPGQFSSDPLEFLEHLKKIGKPAVCGMALDFYHPAAQNLNEWLNEVEDNFALQRQHITKQLKAIYSDCKEYVLHIHVAGCFTDNTVMRGELHIYGQLIDYLGIMDFIWKSGYTGNYLIEYIPTEGADSTLKQRQSTVIAGLASAVSTCIPRK